MATGEGEIDSHLKTGGENLEFIDKVTGLQNVNRECFDVFTALKIRRRHRFAIFRIDSNGINVESASDRNATFDDFKNSLPYTECRFCVYDHEFKSTDGRIQSKLYFICWFPNNSTPHKKMAYASLKTKFQEVVPGTFEAQASSIEDVCRAVLGISDQDDDDDLNDDSF